jgi:Peptidase family M1 domain
MKRVLEVLMGVISAPNEEWRLRRNSMNSNSHATCSAFFAAMLAVSAHSLFPGVALAQAHPGNAANDGKAIYDRLKSFDLTGGASFADNLTLKRDRTVITFQSGTFYFSAPVEGQVRGAVFIGVGNVYADVPPSDYERNNVRRMLNADAVESDFKTVVLRFTDDTFTLIGKSLNPSVTPPAEATKLAAEFERRFLRETGANPSARLTVSILDKESPGFFLAEFDKGRRGRFTFLLDPQCRIPATNFEIDAGEKGVIFATRGNDENEIWMAFPGLEDYQRGQTSYSDLSNLVDTPHYDLRLDLREPKKLLKLTANMELVSRAEIVRAVPLALNEDLPARDDTRRKKGLHVTSARLVGGPALDFVQEEWESGLTLLLPPSAVVRQGQKFSIEVDVEGNFMGDTEISGLNYPRSNESWYPRHGRLARSTFDLVFLHRKDRRVVSAGRRLREDPSPEDKNDRVTEFRIDDPIPLITFAIGPFELHTETAQIPNGSPIPVEFYSLPGRLMPIKEDFILAELGNSVRYFSQMFGPYPYPVFRAVFHPFDFGQGFPTMLMIPATDSATARTFSFIAHETSHQWWGDIVLWRSYRDQWLSEGFAEYSGLLYTRFRDKPAAGHDLLNEMRDSLKNPPKTQVGIGKGRLVDVGPIIMGRRLSTRETEDAYTDLIYNKGALVLRMLHFLFTDAQTGDGTPFFDMMSDFVRRNRNSAASTEAFFAIANERVSQTSLARKYGYKNLDWFFQQWVLGTSLPSYRLEYRIENQPDGMFALKGTVIQEGVPEREKWFMPLPVVLHFPGDKLARGIVAAIGPQTPVNIVLPLRPERVELDPDRWILSDKTTAQNVGR